MSFILLTACLFDKFLCNNDPLKLSSRHLSLDNVDSLDIKEIKLLDEGGTAEVHSVRYKIGVLYARETMAPKTRPDMNFEVCFIQRAKALNDECAGARLLKGASRNTFKKLVVVRCIRNSLAYGK